MSWSDRRRAERAENVAGVAVALLVIVALVLGCWLAWERGYNSGYNDGWNDGRADLIDDRATRATGWRECIEENNLYNRY